MTWYWDQPDARGVRFGIRAVGQTAMSSVGSIIGMDEGQAVVSEESAGNRLRGFGQAHH